MKEYTQIPNMYIVGESALINKELATILIILMNRGFKNGIMINVNYLMEQLNLRKKEVINILIELQDKGILYYCKDKQTKHNINLNYDIDKNRLFYAVFDLEITDDYTQIYDEELLHILNYKKKNINNYTMLEIFLYITQHINNNKEVKEYKTAFPSYAIITEELCISENTLIKYLNILKEEQLLIFDYAGYKETAKGEIKNGNMYYARYEDEEILLNLLTLIRSEKGFIKVNKRNKDKSNLKRSLKQRINKLKKEGVKTKTDKEQLKLLIKEYEETNKGKKEKEK